MNNQEKARAKRTMWRKVTKRYAKIDWSKSIVIAADISVGAAKDMLHNVYILPDYTIDPAYENVDDYYAVVLVYKDELEPVAFACGGDVVKAYSYALAEQGFVNGHCILAPAYWVAEVQKERKKRGVPLIGEPAPDLH